MRRTLLALAAVVALGACGSSDKGAGGSTAGDNAPAAQRGLTGGSAPDAQGAARAKGRGPDGIALDRAVVRTATVRVEVGDLPAARSAAVDAAERLGGVLAGEHTELDRETRLTLRVPPARFTTLLDEFAELGAVRSQEVTTEDVTEAVADVEGRLAAMKASARRLRSLMARAGSVSEIASVEGEVNQREGEIEALESRLRALAGETELATVTVTLAKPAPPAAKPKVDVGGFRGGLRGGWLAFTAVVSALLVVSGALLPFAATAAVVAVPVVLYRRRRRGRYSASTP
jgi:hypothetical protein